jgi:hypothetical protein
LIAIGLLLLLSLPPSCRVVAAQEDERTRESRNRIFDLSEDETEQEKPSTENRFLIGIDLPSPTQDKEPAKVEQPDKPVPQTAGPETELWQVVRQLQQDFEMLKEEIAQLRSELRSIIPEASDKKDDTKVTITPFWVGDVPPEEKVAGGG